MPESRPGPIPEPILDFCDPTDPDDSDIDEELLSTRDQSQDDDENEIEEEVHVDEKEIVNWMSPTRAKQKELLLLGQYRRCGKIEKRMEKNWVIREKQADKIKRQHLAIKQLRLCLRQSRKSCNDIVEMTLNSNKN